MRLARECLAVRPVTSTAGDGMQRKMAPPHQRMTLLKPPVWLGNVRGPFSLFGCLGHALKKDGRAFYWRRLAGTVNFPPPGLLGSPSPLHDERIVGWVKYFTHELLDGDGRVKFQTRGTTESLPSASAPKTDKQAARQSESRNAMIRM